METTNEFKNKSLFQYITPVLCFFVFSHLPQNCVLTWTRAIVANRMATSGDEWTKIFARYNSGT